VPVTYHPNERYELWPTVEEYLGMFPDRTPHMSGFAVCCRGFFEVAANETLAAVVQGRFGTTDVFGQWQATPDFPTSVAGEPPVPTYLLGEFGMWPGP
jgi:hypothetical protein